MAGPTCDSTCSVITMPLSALARAALVSHPSRRPLPPHLLDVLVERHRRGAGVLAGFQHFPGQRAARFGQPEYGAHASHSERASYLEVVLQFQRFHQILDHAEFETDRGG